MAFQVYGYHKPEKHNEMNITKSTNKKQPANETNLKVKWCIVGNPDNKRLLLIDDGDEEIIVIFADEVIENACTQWYIDRNFTL